MIMSIIKPTQNRLEDLNFAILMFDGAEEQDVVGAWEMFWWGTNFESLPRDKYVTNDEFAHAFGADKDIPNVYTVAYTTKPIRMSSGMKFIADYSFDNAPKPDVIVVPGGLGGRNLKVLEDNGTIDYIKKVVPDCKYVMSVCTGTFLLGGAGVLDGKSCTTYHNQYERFIRENPKAKLVQGEQLSFVQEGNLLTSDGPCSGLATSLRLIELHCGTDYKDMVRNLLAYLVPPVKGILLENGVQKEIHV